MEAFLLGWMAVLPPHERQKGCQHGLLHKLQQAHATTKVLKLTGPLPLYRAVLGDKAGAFEQQARKAARKPGRWRSRGVGGLDSHLDSHPGSPILGA